MLNTFLLSFRLKNTYKVNTIIYSIKQIPLINRILPDALYQSKALKIIGNIISVMLELGSIFIGKLLYLWLMVYTISTLYTNSATTKGSFLTIFLALSMIGSYLNTYMFNPSKDKYYAMFLMRMDAKKYTLSNYTYSILKIIVGFMPFTILFGSLSGIGLITCVLLPFLVASLKIIVAAIVLKEYEKKKIILNENRPIKFMWGITAILLAIGYGLPFLGITINELTFSVLMIIIISLGILAISYVKKFNQYREIYQEVLGSTSITMTANTQAIIVDSVQKQIDLSTNITSSKKGFAYFNDLFIKRHRKILIQSAKKIAAISLFLIIGILVITQLNGELKQKINQLLMMSLPYFVFIMYMINRGQAVTQAMFMNCDHSMLTYSFYKEPKAIVQLFKERIKSIALINLLPAIVIGLGLPLILYATGGTENNYEYLILFLSIISMSLFFSVHHLILYYLLQPYNVNSETKSSTYTIASTLTYLACYYLLRLQIPILTFGIITIIFAIVYCLLSLMIAYQLAPKTFKIRI